MVGGELRGSFGRVWGHPPFDYQLRVAEALLGDRNVVLVAPTGSGKTVAALHPFVHACRAGMDWVDRVLYALPLRTLSSALAQEYRPGLEHAGLRVTLQTGLNKDDPSFRGDVCFATMDQVLSAYVGQPVSVGRRQANLVGGALVGAYLVLDEFHLLETRKALATALDLGRRLKGLAPMLIMSATAPDAMIDFLASQLEAEVIVPDSQDVARMQEKAKRTRRYCWCPKPLTADEVRAHHGRLGSRTMVVVNTVDRAQALYRELDEDKPPGAKVLLLHSRFLPGDRGGKERQALIDLEEGSKANVILVSTQVVEVGLNVSCHQLLTEVAPANSVVQRAGRCARFKEETGEVIIYDLPVNERGRTCCAPYPPDEVESTREAIARCLGPGPQRSDFWWERALVEDALGSIAAEAMKGLNLAERSREVAEALAVNPQAAYRRLVRDVPSVGIIISSDPGSLDLRAGVDVFSVSDMVLRGFFGRLEWSGAHAGMVRYPVWDEGAGDDETLPLVRSWEAAGSAKEALDRARIDYVLAVSPTLASYDREVGLRLGEAGTWESGSLDKESATGPAGGGHQEQGGKGASPGPSRLGPRQRGSLRRGLAETFRRHALEVGWGVRRLAASEARAAFRRIGVGLGLEPDGVGALTRWVEIAARLHDIGKLTPSWQAGIWEREAVHGQPESRSAARGESRFLAHSGTSGLEWSGRRLPPHSVSGALVAYQVLRRLIDEPGLGSLSSQVMAGNPEAGPKAPTLFLVAPVVAAIARHHHPLSRATDGVALAPEARDELCALLADSGEKSGRRTCEPDRAALLAGSVPIGASATQAKGLLDQLWCLVSPENPLVWSLYWLAVRLIRLADQLSQEALAEMAGTRAERERRVLTSEEGR